MREIKFRYWDMIHKNFITDCEVYFVAEDYILAGDVGNPPLIDVSGHVQVSQYTGLKDKNGREIYEGDVLLFNNTHPNAYLENWLCVVKYRCGSFVCEYPKDGVYNHFDSWNDFVKWEVIGNRFENPELLEVAE